MATRKLNLIEARADAAGLAVATWSPGDGATRYRFFKKAPDAKHPYADYSEGGHLKTLMGKKEALAFIDGYSRGKATHHVRTR